MAEPYERRTPADIYLEGRCRRCGMRVTVDRGDNGHTRNGRWCGPVETHHPFVVTDDPPGDDWIQHYPNDGSADSIGAAPVYDTYR